MNKQEKKQLKQQWKQKDVKQQKHEKVGSNLGCIGYIAGFIFILILIFGDFEVGSPMFFAQGVALLVFLAFLVWFIIRALREKRQQATVRQEHFAKAKRENTLQNQSYVDEKTGKMYLRSSDYAPEIGSGQEWIVSGGTITIGKAGRASKKTVLISSIYDLKSSSTTMSFKVGGRQPSLIGGTTVVIDEMLPDEEIRFTMGSTPVAQKILDHIASNSTPNQQQVQQSSTNNVVDDLAKLRTLLDDGTLTQEEFEHKKKKLLEM